MEEVTEKNFLWDILSSVNLFKARISEGTGVVTQIMCILEEVMFCELALLLRSALNFSFYILKKENSPIIYSVLQIQLVPSG